MDHTDNRLRGESQKGPKSAQLVVSKCCFGSRNHVRRLAQNSLLAAIGNHFNYTTADGAVSHIYSSKELNSFLDDGNCGVLCAHVELTHDVKIVQVCSDSLPEMELQGERWLVVFHLHPVPITTDNLHSSMWKRRWRASITPCRRCTYILLKESKWSKVCIVGQGGLVLWYSW